MRRHERPISYTNAKRFPNGPEHAMCCKSFSLMGKSIDYYVPFYEAYQRCESVSAYRYHDIKQMFEMVIPLPDNLFRCKHVTEQGDCAIYDTRPQMCRGYPYDGAPCEFGGCLTYDKCNGIKKLMEENSDDQNNNTVGTRSKTNTVDRQVDAIKRTHRQDVQRRATAENDDTR